MTTGKSKKAASLWEVVITNVVTALVTICVALINSNAHHQSETDATKEVSKKVEQLTININQMNAKIANIGDNKTEQHNTNGANVGRDNHGTIQGKE